MRKIDYDLNWGSHLPVLMKVMSKTTGPVLEIGAGLYSTPFLYWLCKDQKRNFVSYENDFDWWKMIWNFKTVAQAPILHKFTDTLTHSFYVENWDRIDIDYQFWDVVLIDHCPSQRRIIEIEILANNANYIIVHDTQRNRRFCDFEKIYSLFKYKFVYNKAVPHTTILSNFKDLSWLKN